MVTRPRRQAAVAPTPAPAGTAIAAADQARDDAFNPSTSHASAPPSLEHVRAQSLRQRADSERTISELKAWRDEIAATIAFLEAQRK